MGSARQPTVIDDPIATETAHIIDAYIYSEARQNDTDLVDLSGKTVTFLVNDGSTTESYTGVTQGTGHTRFTFGSSDWENAGEFTAQLYIDTLLIYEYVGEFKEKLAP